MAERSALLVGAAAAAYQLGFDTFYETLNASPLDAKLRHLAFLHGAVVNAYGPERVSVDVDAEQDGDVMARILLGSVNELTFSVDVEPADGGLLDVNIAVKARMMRPVSRVVVRFAVDIDVELPLPLEDSVSE